MNLLFYLNSLIKNILTNWRKIEKEILKLLKMSHWGILYEFDFVFKLLIKNIRAENEMVKFTKAPKKYLFGYINKI